MSWLPSDMKKSIVMIGEPDVKSETSFSCDPAGSGALIRYKENLWVVTAKHVIEKIHDPTMMFNDIHGRIKGYRTSYLSNKFSWEWKYHTDKDVDLAIIRFGIELGEDDVKFIPSDLFIEFDYVNDGEDVFFIGFPLGLTNQKKITPAIRQGCVSLQIASEMKWGKIRYPPKTILIDGQVSSGNSGSPVFRKPTIAPSPYAIGPSQPSLFGIVIGHIQSKIYNLDDIPMPIARENSGLGIVSATDHIITLLDQY